MMYHIVLHLHLMRSIQPNGRVETVMESASFDVRRISDIRRARIQEGHRVARVVEIRPAFLAAVVEFDVGDAGVALKYV